MLTTAIVAAGPARDIVRIVEVILSCHLVENTLGEFRWQRDFASNNEGELAQYKLEFRHPHSVLGFKLPSRSRIVLVIGGDASDGNRFLYLRWKINSLSGRDLCERIVREAELEIASWLSPELRGSRGDDFIMAANG